MLIVGIITGLIILVLLIVAHELGHAVVARRNGVKVEEFGIGFPPRAWARKLGNGVLFSLNWLPLGGFVRLHGEHDSATGKGTYGAASFWVKTKILLAGVVMNWLVAAVLFTVLAWVGLPKLVEGQFVVPADARIETSQVTLASIVPDSAAEKAGFQAGDVVVAVDGETIESGARFIELTREHRGQAIELTYRRDGDEQTRAVTLGDNTARGVFGAAVGQRETIHATWSAPIVGVVTTAQLSWETLSGLGEMVGKLGTGVVRQLSSDEGVREQAARDIDEVAGSVAGPVGILGVIFPSAQQQGPVQLVLLTAVISLTLAVMNILPIPALDGGRWWTMAIFRVLKKKLTREREETIQLIGFLVLFGLIILITIADIGKLGA